MSVTHILPTTHDIYWFVDLGETIISGLTEPGQLTTTKFDIDQDKDEKILIEKLKGREHKLREDGCGFSFRDGSVVFSRTPLDVSQLDSSQVK
jgi:hypothetical protein